MTFSYSQTRAHVYIYIYTHTHTQVLFYTLGVEYYSTPQCYTEQNSVSLVFVFQYFVVLSVGQVDTEHSPVLLSIFSTQF